MVDTAENKDIQAAEGADERQVYEVGFHLLPKLDEEQAQKGAAEIKQAVEKAGGSIIAEGAPELIDLAYTMVKVINNQHERFDTAYFGWIKFEAERGASEDLKKVIEAREDLLRYIIIKTTRTVAAPRPTRLREVKTQTGKTITTPRTAEEGGEVSDEELAKKLDEIVT